MDETKRHRGLRILIPAAVTALFARAIAVFLHVGPRLDIALQLIFFVACLMTIVGLMIHYQEMWQLHKDRSK